MERWVSASCSSPLGSRKLGRDVALGSSWEGIWVYLEVSQRESLIALGGGQTD